MECHISRSILRLSSSPATPTYFRYNVFKSVKVIPSCIQGTEKRLYHSDSGGLPFKLPRINRMILLSTPVLTSKQSLTYRPQLARTLIVSKIIDTLREAELTSLFGISKFIIESTPVSMVRSVYEWSEATTGLPWAANILLCSLIMQFIFNAPANVYLGRWSTGKEKQSADLIAVRASLMRAPTKRDFVIEFKQISEELAKQYGCEQYKFISAIIYQLVYVTISSFGVRSLLQNPAVSEALLPWGTMLGAPDPMFVFPVVNLMMSLLLVEVGAWKRLKSIDGLKMTYRRASLPFHEQPLWLLNVQRIAGLPMVLIFCIVPSGLTLHWFAMMIMSLNVQILLTRRQTRRALGMPTTYFETDNPYKDFLHYLRHDVTFRKKMNPKLPKNLPKT